MTTLKVMQLYCGNSNLQLAKRLAKELEKSLRRIEISRFSNDEARVYIPEGIKSRKVVVFQSLSQPVDKHIVEFCLICDALKRLGVSEIIAIIPWFAYSKQDRVFRIGEPLSVKVIAKLIQTAPIDRILTLDLHNLSIAGFFDIPVHNVSVRPLFLKYFNKLKKDNLVVVAPDAGSVKSATEFARQLGVSVVYIDKKRDIKTGKVSIQGVSSDIKGKEIVMIDDMVVTGGTLIKVSQFLKKRGVKNIYCAITHHLYVDGTQKKLEESAIDRLIITDTVKKPKGIKLRKTTVISCAPLIAETIKLL